MILESGRCQSSAIHWPKLVKPPHQHPTHPQPLGKPTQNRASGQGTGPGEGFTPNHWQITKKTPTVLRIFPKWPYVSYHDDDREMETLWYPLFKTSHTPISEDKWSSQPPDTAASSGKKNIQRSQKCRSTPPRGLFSSLLRFTCSKRSFCGEISTSLIVAFLR